MNDTKCVQQECGICLMLGSMNPAKSHPTGNHRWSAHDHKIIGERVSNPPQNSETNAQQVHGGKAEKGNQTSSGGSKILAAQAVPNAQEIGLHQVPVGSLVDRKIQMAPSVAEIEIQVKPPNPAETKEMPKDPRARVEETHLGPPLQARARGVAVVEVPYTAAVAVEGAIIVWISSPVQIRCQMQTEITPKKPSIQQMICFMRSGLMNLAVSTRFKWPLEVRTP